MNRMQICVACDCVNDEFPFTAQGRDPFCTKCWESLNDPYQALLCEEALARAEARPEEFQKRLEGRREVPVKGIYEEIFDHVAAEAILRHIPENLRVVVTRMCELGVPWEAIEELGLSLQPDATADELVSYFETLSELQAREKEK